jgi:hypothetical protein
MSTYTQTEETTLRKPATANLAYLMWRPSLPVKVLEAPSKVLGVA